MNTKRLLILAAFLETVPEHKFNLEDWRDTGLERLTSGERINGDYTTDEKLLNNSCGTTGCAIGWACTIPEFIEDGFTWDGSSPLLTNSDTKLYEWFAVEEFFSIDQITASDLFMGYSYENFNAGSKDVAKRIHEVVSNFNKE